VSAPARRSFSTVSRSVATVTAADGGTEAVPAPDRLLAPGDTVHAAARLPVLREFERAAASPEAEVTS
jgi:hypothetical protein